MQSEIEKMAEQLWAVYFEGTACKKINYPSNSAQKKSFERLAKHVLGVVLEAKIQTISDFADTKDPQIRSYWVEYQNELSSLE